MKSLWTILGLCLLFSVTVVAQDESPKTDTKEERDPATYRNIKGSHSFNLGIGFPNLAASAFKIGNAVGFENEGSASPVFSFKYEYGLSDNLGAGLHIGYYTAKTPTTEEIIDIVGNGQIEEIIGGFGCELGLPPNPLFNCDTIYGSDEVVTQEGGSYNRINSYTLGGRFAYYRGGLFGIDELDMYGSIILGYAIVNRKRIGDANADFERFKAPTFIYFASAGARYYITPNIGLYGEIGYGQLTVANVGLTYRILPKEFRK